MKHNNDIIVLTLATLAMYFSIDSVALAGAGDILKNINLGVGSGGFYLGVGGAGAAGGIATALCNIAAWFQGGVGQAIASLAIIFLGISAFFGKVTWGTALTAAVGVFAIFGSASIVKAIVGGAAGGGSGWSGFISAQGWGVGYNSNQNCGGF